MRLNRFLLPFCAPGLVLAWSTPASGETTTFGPVSLRAGQKFELCVNARSAQQSVGVQARFHPINDATIVIRSMDTILDPGRGGCIAVDFQEVGETPIFAVLESDGELPADEELAGSACAINGVFFDCFPPRTAEHLVQGGGIGEVVTFGPVRLKPGLSVRGVR